MSRIRFFRAEAQQERCESVVGGVIMIHPLSLSVLTTTMASIALAVMLLFVFGRYTRRITVEGVVVPDVGLVKVYGQQPGVVLHKNVSEGQHVMGGAVLYTISTDLQSAVEGQTHAALIERAHQRKESLQQEMKKIRELQQAERETVMAKLVSLRTERARIEDQLATQSERLKIAADDVTRYERLHGQDYISTDQLHQRKTDLLEQKSKSLGLQRERGRLLQSLKETANELEGLDLKQQNLLAQIERSVIDIEETMIESQARREVAIPAPRSGIVTAVIAEAGQAVGLGRPLASIVPDGAVWQVHLFVPSAAIGFVHIGDHVRVRYRAYPFQKFGHYGARVASIARTALSANELWTSAPPAADGKAFYRVTATLDQQTVVAYGKPQSLQAGMALEADILQESRRLYEWVFQPLYGVADKF
ncbi:HlyD family secretion protein [Trinickia caryophylli]|uniref:HlyD family secretion protein n=1 Tax=Trinickia caryophylli TaxID=28094 RepID=UPI0032DBD566